MCSFLKELPNYHDEAIPDTEIERLEVKVMANILSHCVEAAVANIQFDKTTAADNDDVDGDGLYIGTHHCVGRYATICSDAYSIELWASVIPDDEENAGMDYLFWTFGVPSMGIDPIGPIAYCPCCGLRLESMIKHQAHDEI